MFTLTSEEMKLHASFTSNVMQKMKTKISMNKEEFAAFLQTSKQPLDTRLCLKKGAGALLAAAATTFAVAVLPKIQDMWNKKKTKTEICQELRVLAGPLIMRTLLDMDKTYFRSLLQLALGPIWGTLAAVFLVDGCIAILGFLTGEISAEEIGPLFLDGVFGSVLSVFFKANTVGYVIGYGAFTLCQAIITPNQVLHCCLVTLEIIKTTLPAALTIVSGFAIMAGANAGTAVMILGSMGASAGTGTAISALNGAAATNAALAWLGGGTLASGGGGMAAGGAVVAAVSTAGIGIAVVGGLGLAYKVRKYANRPKTVQEALEREGVIEVPIKGFITVDANPKYFTCHWLNPFADYAIMTKEKGDFKVYYYSNAEKASNAMKSWWCPRVWFRKVRGKPALEIQAKGLGVEGIRDVVNKFEETHDSLFFS